MRKMLLRLSLLSLVGGLMLATGGCSAQTAAPQDQASFTDGTDYHTLPAPNQRYSDSGKVEVVEVFSYGCIHCAQFAPLAEKLRKELPPGVEFKLLPAPFSDEWIPYARAYYAAKQLGVVEQTHLALFKARFDDHYPIYTLDDLADFYAKNGVDRAKFLQIANSDQVSQQIQRDLDLIKKWNVDGTPTIVVDGKYRSGDVTHEQMLPLTLWLVKRELAAKAAK